MSTFAPLQRKSTATQGVAVSRKVAARPLLKKPVGVAPAFTPPELAPSEATRQAPRASTLESSDVAVVPDAHSLWLQTQLEVSEPGDALEQEADRVADRVMRMPLSEFAPPRPEEVSASTLSAPPKLLRACASCPSAQNDEERLQRASEPESLAQDPAEPDVASRERQVNSAWFERFRTIRSRGGEPLSPSVRQFMEPRFGANFERVKVHRDAEADALSRTVNARAFTVGQDLFFKRGEFAPGTERGQRLIAHELAHSVQQRRSVPQNGQHPAIQRQVADPAPPDANSFAGPLTEREWQLIDLWLSMGEVGVEPLTGDANHNADVVAAAIFCSRALSTVIMSQNEDPLLCLDTGVTVADRRVQGLKGQVTARGAIVNWAATTIDSRLSYIMTSLVTTHRFPVNGAAGITGNLFAESGAMPSRIEGSEIATPLRARNAANQVTDFTPAEVMNRSATVGPKKPGVGLAQWTTAARRSGLFQRSQQGRPLGSSVLFNMDAQIEYVVSELRAQAGLFARLSAPGVTLNDASDDVVYNFEIPNSILDAAKNKLPRTNPAVQAVFNRRRGHGQAALRAYQAAQAAQAAAGH